MSFYKIYRSPTYKHLGLTNLTKQIFFKMYILVITFYLIIIFI